MNAKSFLIGSLALAGLTVLPIQSGVASAVCVSGTAYTTASTFARETPNSGTCDGDRFYKLTLTDIKSDGYEARIQGRYTKLSPGATWLTYGTTNANNGQISVAVTMNDTGDTTNMQLRLCHTGGVCASPGTNSGH